MLYRKVEDLECTKEELHDHVRETYRDEKRYDPLPTMNKLIPPPVPKISFRLGALTKKEVDDRVKKARAKSGPGGDGVSYKVYKYCSQLRHYLYVLLKQLWKEKTLVDLDGTLSANEFIYCLSPTPIDLYLRLT